MSKMNSVRMLLLLAVAPAFLFGESKTPSIGYTGAPADHGGQNCSTCHTSFGAANSDKTGSLQVTVTDYTPTEPQKIRIIVQHPQASRWGFQITIREQSDETLSSGVFSVIHPADPVQVACDDGTQFGSPGPCNGTIAHEFAEHLNAPTGPVGTAYEFDVSWMPPPQEVGRLHVYVAAVAANDDGTPLGDRVYTYTQTLNNAGGCDFTKAPVLQSLANGASFQPQFSSNGMVSIFGDGFQTSGRSRAAGLGDLVDNLTAYPTELGCVGVQVTGPGLAQPVSLPIAFVNPTQINAQMPEFVGTGPVQLTVILNPGVMNAVPSPIGTFQTLEAFAPAFFLFPNSTSIAAEDAQTGFLVGDPKVVPGASPAKPGDTVALYGTGFGDTNPATVAGEIPEVMATVTNPVTVEIGGVTLPASDVQYAGISPGSISGLYQFNVVIPASTPNGDIPVTITIGGVQTPSATIAVQQ